MSCQWARSLHIAASWKAKRLAGCHLTALKCVAAQPTTVIVSDERVCSPILNAFDTAVILNQQSLDKFESKVKPGGVLLYDPNGITHKPTRTDIKIYTIEGAKLASETGNTKVFNMIILGAFLKLKPIITMDNVEEGLRHSLPERAHKLIPLNMKAVQIGMENVK